MMIAHNSKFAREGKQLWMFKLRVDIRIFPVYRATIFPDCMTTVLLCLGWGATRGGWGFVTPPLLLGDLIINRFLPLFPRAT